MSTTIENYCIDCKAVAQPDCEQRGHVVGTLGSTEPDVEPEPGSTAASDPWAAVHRIKVKHEALVEAAIAAVNCYEWQGEQQAQFLAEAMGELKTAVVAVSKSPKWVNRQLVAENNQHAALVAERERLLRLLRPVTSPTSCYCAVMKDEKCWHCEARELLAGTEQGGETR